MFVMTLELKACDVIYSSRSGENLVIIDSSLVNVHAATVLSNSTEVGEDIDKVTVPGTYTAKYLGEVSLIESWAPERIAIALANTLFADHPELRERFTQKWLNSLTEAALHDPFTI